ncbi:MAG: SIMPL domain-containing protein [Asticcacaulis sp.]
MFISTKSHLLKSLAVGTLLAGLSMTPALAQAQPQTQPMPGMMMPAPSTLNLSAAGQISATPDMATINFAVVTQGATASEAMKANNVRMNTVMSALKSAGIAAKDIQTSSLNLNPQYDYKDGQAPKLTGYQAQNQITVRVNDLSQTGPVIDTVIKAGINQIDSINFGLKNDDALKDQARQAAIATLTKRANLYAAAAGMKVKRIINITESNSDYQPPRPMMMMKAERADSSTPVSDGELQLSVNVTAEFELE